MLICQLYTDRFQKYTIATYNHGNSANVAELPVPVLENADSFCTLLVCLTSLTTYWLESFLNHVQGYI